MDIYMSMYYVYLHVHEIVTPSLVSTVFTDVEKVWHSWCASESSLLRQSIDDPPLRIYRGRVVGFPGFQRVRLASAGDGVIIVALFVEPPHSQVQQL